MCSDACQLVCNVLSATWEALTDGVYSLSSSTLLPAIELNVGTLPESVVNLLVRVKPLFSLVGGGNLLPFLGGLTRPSKVFSPCELRWLLNLNSSILSLVLFEKAMLVVYVIMVQYSTTSSLRQLSSFRFCSGKPRRPQRRGRNGSRERSLRRGSALAAVAHLSLPTLSLFSSRGLGLGDSQYTKRYRHRLSRQAGSVGFQSMNECVMLGREGEGEVRPQCDGGATSE